MNKTVLTPEVFAELSYVDQVATVEGKEVETPAVPALQSENLLETVSSLSGPGFAKLRSSLNGQFGIRLESTGARQNPELTRVIMQTLDASPANPYLITFEQFILTPFTGAGQFDLVERDSIRRSIGGASAGGTAVLTDLSGVMNWQSGDVDKPIRVGINPGRWHRIASRQSPTQVTLAANITLPLSGLTLTMDGESEVTIADKDGFTDVDAVGGWSRFTKVITSDKVYSVVFVPGTAGDGIYSISVREAVQGGK